MARKITFKNIGIVEGSRVWLNTETGVEIIKGKNFTEVGLYYVCVPTQDAAGRRVFGAESKLHDARSLAAGFVEIHRNVIATAHEAAITEDATREAVAADEASALTLSMIQSVDGHEAAKQIRTWWERHGLNNVQGITADDILSARTADHEAAITEDTNRASNEAIQAGANALGITASREMAHFLAFREQARRDNPGASLREISDAARVLREAAALAN